MSAGDDPESRDDDHPSEASSPVFDASESSDDDTTASPASDRSNSLEDDTDDPTTGSADEFRSRRRETTSERTDPQPNILSRVYRADHGALLFVREIASSAFIVLLIGALLFGASGVWPPMVAIESGSMEPNIEKYDLVFVTEPGRFAPDGANDDGIVTRETGESIGYSSFNEPGSVIVFDDPASGGPPIIHRPHMYVQSGENWIERADRDYAGGASCADVSTCPADTDGYVTKGDNNARYDQTNRIAPIVEDEWVSGVARVRIPYLGWIRLAFTGQTILTPSIPLLGIAIGAAFRKRNLWIDRP
ncbi:MAG: S26 family signal peptidase [Halobacteriota archaeon]